MQGLRAAGDDESSSDDDSDEKAPVHTTADGHEISEYEMLRLERIKRNRDYLAQLGLEGALGKKRPVQKKKKKIVQVEPNERRSSLSRRSKERSINYLDSSASITQLVKDENRGKGRRRGLSTFSGTHDIQRKSRIKTW